ncbi:MAG TPA: hypothetical protein VKG62_06715 [Solirubrobacteraceae bacterium]|nr:hypothetical protein [Solirubrobacteraceae bacterium]
MSSKWIDRQIDEILLTTAMSAGLLYARRRIRRLLPKVMIGGAVATTLGAAAAGVGVLALAGAAAAWYQRRSRAVTPAAGWYPSGSSAPAAATAGSGAGDGDLKDAPSGRSAGS